METNEKKSLWRGIKKVFSTLVDWVATLFGMKDETKYGRVLRRIVGTAFTVVVVLWATGILVIAGQKICWIARNILDRGEEYGDAYLSETISENLSFYEHSYNIYGYVADSNGEIVLKKITWISKPMEGDSLVCYSDGEKRGYFHMRNGHIIVPPTYSHAWVFSEGLAAVERNGKVKFIDTTGNVVINRHFAYRTDDDGYVFHGGHCAVRDNTGTHIGLIDRNGEWVVPPVYQEIVPIDTFWHFKALDEQTILTFNMDTVMPPAHATFMIYDTVILATFADHIQKTYSLHGKLIEASQIRNITQLMYETHEVLYPVNKDGNECSDEYYSYSNPAQRMAIATCLRYEAESYWYGLMTPDGRALTPPIYSSIEAIDKDLYLCKSDYDRGVLLNSKGQKVE